MMEASTPIVNKNLRLNIENVTPFKRKSVVNVIPDFVEKSDDKQERERRRSNVQINRRLSTIPRHSGSSGNDSVIVSEEEVYGHFQLCMKLFADNKISINNVWNLKIIDYLHVLNKSLQVAGTSLEVSAKVYGLKVDVVYNEGMKLASAVVSGKDKNADGGNDETANAGGDNGDEAKQHEQKKKKQKRPKRLIGGQKATIAKDVKTLLGSIQKVESTYFQTQSKSDLSAIDNLFTSRLPVNPSGYKFLFEGNEKTWTTLEDIDLAVDEDVDKTYPCDLPQFNGFKLCPAFADFDLGDWNPDDDDKLQRSFRLNNEPLCYDNGLPVAELDGSVHDIFQEDAGNTNGMDEFVENDFTAHMQGRVEHIVSFKPNHLENVTEYSYNTTFVTQSGKILDKIWAGPSHWKLKYIRPSMARFSGRPINPAEKEPQKRRKKKEKITSKSLDFVLDGDNVLKSVDVNKKLNVKKKSTTCDPHKITFPMPVDIDLRCHILSKPIILQKKKVSDKEEDCEIQPYNYDNPSDSLYCSRDGVENFNNDDDDCEEPVNAHFAGDNLIEAPEYIPKNSIQFAKHSKKINMKKLKATVWTYLTDGKADPAAPNKEVPVVQRSFSEVYKWLPQHISEDMRRDLSCALAFAAVLHVCNEQNLELVGQSDLKDFRIKKN